MRNKLVLAFLGTIGGLIAMGAVVGPPQKRPVEASERQVMLPNAEITNRNYNHTCIKVAFSDTCEGKSALFFGMVGPRPKSDFGWEPVKFHFRAENGSEIEVHQSSFSGGADVEGAEVYLSGIIQKMTSTSNNRWQENTLWLKQAEVVMVKRTKQQIHDDEALFKAASVDDINANMKSFRQACYDDFQSNPALERWRLPDMAEKSREQFRNVRKFVYDRSGHRTINICADGPWVGEKGLLHPWFKGFRCTETGAKISWTVDERFIPEDCTASRS